MKKTTGPADHYYFDMDLCDESLDEAVTTTAVFPQICNKCSRIYQNKDSFIAHQKRCRLKPDVKYPRTCDKCFVAYESKQSFSNHRKRCQSNPDVSWPRTCEVCGLDYQNVDSFRGRHKRCQDKLASALIPEKSLSAVDTLQPSKCDLGIELNVNTNCKELNFPSMEEFKKWLDEEGSRTFSSFIKMCGTKVTEKKNYHYYVCQFHRLKKSKIPVPVTNRRNSKGVIPTNIYCPVSLKVTEECGAVSVRYESVHNHARDFHNCRLQPIKKSARDLIKVSLEIGVGVENIQNTLRDGALSRNERDVIPAKEMFVTRRDIRRYASNLEHASRPDDDTLSVSITVEQLRNEKYDPVLLYKPQGHPVQYGLEDINSFQLSGETFILGLQTEEQKNMMIEGSYRVLCIDSTHGTNQYDFYLLNLLVPDEFGHGYPVAHFVTNRLDISTFHAIFSSLKERIPELYVNCIMTDDDGVTYKAFSKVFGVDIKHLLCHWHIRQSWKKQLQSKVMDSNLREEIYSNLRMLLEERNESLFNAALRDFIDQFSVRCPEFVHYFETYYVDRAVTWAMCHRNFPHAKTDTNMYCESFHNKLKTFYLERRPNRRLDSLIKVLLSAEKDTYINHLYKVLTDHSDVTTTKFVQDRHIAGMKIPDSDVNKISENVWCILSQTNKSKQYTVTRLHHQCRQDLCYETCCQLPCVNLCVHMYKCCCPDKHALCKHIHKIHSTNGKILEADINVHNDNNLDPIVPSYFKTDSIDKSMEMFTALTSKLETLVKRPKVHDLLWTFVKNNLEKLVSVCEGADKKNFPLNQCKLQPKTISPNQKVEPQFRLHKTRKQQVKRKRVPDLPMMQNITEEISVKRQRAPDKPMQIVTEVKSVKRQFPKLDQIVSLVQREIFMPPLNYFDCMDKPVLRVNNCHITVAQFKSLDTNISDQEVAILQKTSRDFAKGQLYDNIIDAFLREIIGGKSAAIDCVVTQFVDKGGSCSSLDVHTLEHLFIPVNLSHHWVLFEVDLKERTFIFFDPMGAAVNAYTGVMKSWIRVLNEQFNYEYNWKLICPQHVYQTDNNSCGVFVCYFAYQRHKGLEISKPFNVLHFRQFMYSTLAKKCLDNQAYTRCDNESNMCSNCYQIH